MEGGCVLALCWRGLLVVVSAAGRFGYLGEWPGSKEGRVRLWCCMCGWCPYLWEVIAEEHAGNEWEGGGAVGEACEVLVEVGGVDMQAWI